jgi:hypothetical protein
MKLLKNELKLPSKEQMYDELREDQRMRQDKLGKQALSYMHSGKE